MALYPKGGPRPTSSNAELAFYKALMKGLPPGWQAWHSLKLRLGKDWEGEGDFVIAVPKRAIVIVEVKGGAVECRDGQWLQNGKPMRSPRDQAHRFRNILGTTLAKTVSVPPILIITAFPDTPFQLPPSHGDLADAVLGQQDLTWQTCSKGASSCSSVKTGEGRRCCTGMARGSACSRSAWQRDGLRRHGRAGAGLSNGRRASSHCFSRVACSWGASH